MGLKMEFPKWYDRPNDSKNNYKDQDKLDTKNFLKNVDHFITLENTKNKTIKATELKYILMYASGRYSAHVGKNVIKIDDQEKFVQIDAAVNPGDSGAPLINSKVNY